MDGTTTTEAPDRILVLARKRYAAGEGLRGLPRPEGFPDCGWYTKQPRLLRNGETAVYLMYRWPAREKDGTRVHSLGRLN